MDICNILSKPQTFIIKLKLKTAMIKAQLKTVNTCNEVFPVSFNFGLLTNKSKLYLGIINLKINPEHKLAS